jgi:glyoxylase-like metal-dependent hydrolase (beta-lactamase superfamily II)
MQYSESVFYRKMYFSFPMKESPALREVYAALIKGGRNILVDCGVSYNYPDIAALAAEAGLTVADIDIAIITHCHSDHTGGLAALRRENPNVEIWAHPLGKPLIEDPEKQFAARPVPAFHFLNGGGVPVARELLDGEILDIGFDVQVFHTPGHSADSLSLYLPEQRLILSGDAIPYVEDMPIYEDLPALEASLEKLATLSSDTVISSFCGVWRHNQRGNIFDATKRHLANIQKAVDDFNSAVPDAAMGRFVLERIGVAGQPIPIFLASLAEHLKQNKA